MIYLCSSNCVFFVFYTFLFFFDFLFLGQFPTFSFFKFIFNQFFSLLLFSASRRIWIISITIYIGNIKNYGSIDLKEIRELERSKKKIISVQTHRYHNLPTFFSFLFDHPHKDYYLCQIHQKILRLLIQVSSDF